MAFVLKTFVYIVDSNFFDICKNYKSLKDDLVESYDEKTHDEGAYEKKSFTVGYSYDVEQGGIVDSKELVIKIDEPRDNKTLKSNCKIVPGFIYFSSKSLIIHPCLILKECLKRKWMTNLSSFGSF